MAGKLKIFGLLLIASESVDPVSISSQVSMSAFLSLPGLELCSKIRKLRRIGRPASCRMASCRVNAQMCWSYHPRSQRDVSSFDRASLSLPLLHLNLGDEVAHLTYRGLRFFFVRRLDNVFDLLALRVHSLKLESRHVVLALLDVNLALN